VVDGPNNANNRFDVASGLNHRLGDAPGPFWGCPPSAARPAVAPTKGAFPYVSRRGPVLAEYRTTEMRLKARGKPLSSVWKLFTQPTVGSQALLGIPRLHELRFDDALADASLVWPFETGFAEAPGGDRGPLILHCEIWPNAIAIEDALRGIRDAAQMLSLVRWAARLDRDGRLASLLASPAGLTAEDRRVCEAEEGWILGADAG